MSSRHERQRYANQAGLALPRHLVEFQSKRWLAIDLGAGTGWLSAILAESFHTVVAIEPSSSAVDLAKAAYGDAHPNILWVHSTAQDALRILRISEPTFLVSGVVLSHLPDRSVKSICREMMRALPTGSVAVLCEAWGRKNYGPLWFVREPKWWKEALPRTEIDFFGPESPGRRYEHLGMRVRL